MIDDRLGENFNLIVIKDDSVDPGILGKLQTNKKMYSIFTLIKENWAIYAPDRTSITSLII